MLGDMTQKRHNASIHLRIPSDLAARLTAEAEARMVSTTFLVVRALEALLPALPPTTPIDTPSLFEVES